MTYPVVEIEGRLHLHTPSAESALTTLYHKVFSKAVELVLVSAYLTKWDLGLKLNSNCESLRIVVGKDFGITRKAACRSLLNWLPARFKGDFLVAQGIGGFHPKALFWREANGKAYALIGSSNLTDAAFKTNYEANVVSELTPEEFASIRRWLDEIEVFCEPVSSGWLKRYVEASLSGRRGSEKKRSASGDVRKGYLPDAQSAMDVISARRRKLKNFAKQKKGLLQHFRRCASGTITRLECYEGLSNYWDDALDDRLQGKGFPIKGKHSRFDLFSRSLLAIVDASQSTRDDVVKEQMDWLAGKRVPTRKALLSEMLCLLFPDEYPVLNTPVRKFRSAAGLRKPRGASEGADYIFLSRKLRKELAATRGYPAKNLVELDAVIWLKYQKKK